MIPKRVFWLAVGAVAGAGASVRAQQVVKRKVAPYTPERLPGTVVEGVRSIGSGVRGAVADGRDTMREHEARLRAELPVAPRRPAGRSAGTGGRVAALRSVPDPAEPGRTGGRRPTTGR